MQISNEVVTVLLVQTHECATHHDELDFVCVVAKSLQLFDSILGLQIWVIPGSDGTH